LSLNDLMYIEVMMHCELIESNLCQKKNIMKNMCGFIWKSKEWMEEKREI